MTRTTRSIANILTRLGYQWPGGAPPSDLRIRRTRAGVHQRSGGAWAWSLWSDVNPGVSGVGSQYPASELAGRDPATCSLYVGKTGDTALLPEGARCAP